MRSSKTPGTGESPAASHGLISGIFCGEEKCSAVIDGEIVYEGDTIHGVKIMKIHKDGVEFEKKGKRWTQQPEEQPKRAWPKKS